MFGRRAGSDNHELTDGEFVVSSRRSFARGLLLAMTTGVVVVLAGAGVRYFVEHFAPSSRLVTLERENEELREALDKARFDLQVELATRAELERQLAAQSEALREVEEELAFIKAAARKPGG